MTFTSFYSGNERMSGLHVLELVYPVAASVCADDFMARTKVFFFFFP